MTRYKHIKVGDTIETEAGYEVVTGFNGHIVYTESYIIDESDEAVLESEGRFTLSEIAGLFHSIDGRNYKVIFDTED